MAHEAGTVNGTWHFPPAVVLTAVFSLPLSSPYPGAPSQIPCLGVEVKDQSSQGHCLVSVMEMGV